MYNKQRLKIKIVEKKNLQVLVEILNSTGQGIHTSRTDMNLVLDLFDLCYLVHFVEQVPATLTLEQGDSVLFVIMAAFVRVSFPNEL